MPDRDWTDAVAAHRDHRCRVCGDDWLERVGTRLEMAHTIGRTYDEQRPSGLYVHPLSVVLLCGPATTTRTCHSRFDGNRIDLWPYLTQPERAWATARLGSEGAARRRISGRKF